MFDRFSESARRAISLARTEAAQLSHDYLGSEHLLLGLIREGHGKIGIEIENARIEVAKLTKPSLGGVDDGFFPFTPRVKRIFNNAIGVAAGAGHNYVEFYHLLLGLLQEQDCTAVDVLKNLGVKSESLCNEINKNIGVKSGTQVPDGAAVNDLERTIAEQNIELVRVTTESDHWKKRSEEFSMSAHESSKEARSLRKQADKDRKAIDYLSDQILNAYGEIANESD